MSRGGAVHFQRGKAWHQQRTLVPPAQRTSPDGILHNSRSQMLRWCYLLNLEAAGDIRNLSREVRIKLETLDGKISVRTRGTKKKPNGQVRAYTADHVYEEPVKVPRPKEGDQLDLEEIARPRSDTPMTWAWVIEDVKGHLDGEQALRLDVLEALTGIRVRLVKG